MEITPEIVRETKEYVPGKGILLRLGKLGLKSPSRKSTRLVNWQQNVFRIEIENNNFTSLRFLKDSTDISYIKASHNHIKYTKGIRKLTKLTTLDLSFNILQNMKRFENLLELRKLILNNNELKQIEGIENCNKLDTLIISNNQLSFLPNDLSYLPELRRFSASHNQISEISENTFRQCSHLKQLRLAHNSITDIPDSMRYNKSLRILDLGNNKISDLKALEVLQDLPHLNNLNLSGNPVTQEPKYRETILEMFPQLRTLDSKPVAERRGRNRKGLNKKRQRQFNNNENKEVDDDDDDENDYKEMMPAKKRYKSKHQIVNHNNQNNDNEDEDDFQFGIISNKSQPSSKKPSKVRFADNKEENLKKQKNSRFNSLKDIKLKRIENNQNKKTNDKNNKRVKIQKEGQLENGEEVSITVESFDDQLTSKRSISRNKTNNTINNNESSRNEGEYVNEKMQKEMKRLVAEEEGGFAERDPRYSGIKNVIVENAHKSSSKIKSTNSLMTVMQKKNEIDDNGWE